MAKRFSTQTTPQTVAATTPPVPPPQAAAATTTITSAAPVADTTTQCPVMAASSQCNITKSITTCVKNYASSPNEPYVRVWLIAGTAWYWFSQLPKNENYVPLIACDYPLSSYRPF